MDEQNKPEMPENQQPEIQQTPQIDPTPNPQPSIQPAPTTPKPKKKKKWLFVVLALLLIGGGAAVWWFVLRSDGSSPTQDQTNNDNSSQSEITPVPVSAKAPDTIVYAFGDAATNGTNIFWRLATGGDRTQAKLFPKQTYATDGVVRGQQVLISTESQTDGAKVWYSKDAGKTFKQVYPTTTDATTNVGAQITSMSLSSDEKYALAAVSVDGQNTVQKIDLETSAASELFKTKSAGVFLYSYDATNGYVYYEEGCYNCDGNTFTKLSRHNVNDDKDEVIYTSPEGSVGSRKVMSPDFTKALVLNGTPNDEGLGAKAPYSLVEIDIASHKGSELYKSTDKYLPAFGYTEAGRPYYAKDNSIFAVEGNTLLYEATKPIYGVYYVGTDYVIAAVGTYDDFDAFTYTVSTKANTTLFNGEATTRIYGVTTK